MENHFGSGVLNEVHSKPGTTICSRQTKCFDKFCFLKMFVFFLEGTVLVDGIARPIRQTTKSKIWIWGVDQNKSMRGSPKINKWLTPLASNLLCLRWHFLSRVLGRLALDSFFFFLFGSGSDFLLLCVFFFSALLEFNQAVLVSRKDPESRKKAVTQVTERLTSNGYWPQVRYFFMIGRSMKIICCAVRLFKHKNREIICAHLGCGLVYRAGNCYQTIQSHFAAITVMLVVRETTTREQIFKKPLKKTNNKWITFKADYLD